LYYLVLFQCTTPDGFSLDQVLSAVQKREYEPLDKLISVARAKVLAAAFAVTGDSDPASEAATLLAEAKTDALPLLLRAFTALQAAAAADR
jgi:hypothetical protein